MRRDISPELIVSGRGFGKLIMGYEKIYRYNINSKDRMTFLTSALSFLFVDEVELKEDIVVRVKNVKET